MARKKKTGPLTGREIAIMANKVPCGTYPGQNRARTFADRKKKANKNACRGRVKDY